VRSGKTVKLPRPYKFFADEREVVEDAYPGDIIGLPNNREFRLGDTLSAGDLFNFVPIPHFPPEHFARLAVEDVAKQKQFLKGLQQLETEGAMHVLYETDAQRREPILAVVGMLQFDVVRGRLQEEYGVSTLLYPLPHRLCRLLDGPQAQIDALPWRYSMLRTRDANGRLVALMNSEHELNYYVNKYPELTFSDVH
jgi:peptide chain release factor 3